MSVKNIAIGVGLIAGLLVLYNAKQKRNNTPNIYFKKKLTGNANGITIPPFGIWIQESQKDNKALIEHELVHWKQYQEKGYFKFYKDYEAEFHKYGYDKMPMEIEARTIEDDYCKTNYTECVRTGKSKTAHNPKFLL